MAAVSLVDAWSSTVTALKLTSTACLSSFRNRAAETAASVVRYASIVACGRPSLGPIIPEPLQTPARVTRSRPILNSVAAVFRTVSVVRIASANRFACSSEAPRYWPASMMPRSSFSIRSICPMIPVEDGSTSCGLHPAIRAASSHIRSASRKPLFPVQALAFPELMMMLRSVPARTCFAPLSQAPPRPCWW